MASAIAAAGTTREGFEKLPAHEKNAFLAQARGQQRPEARQAENRVRMEPTSAFRRSPFNRSKFDPEKEKELIDSIREHGIIENMIARPMSIYRQVVSFCRKMWAFKKPLKESEILPALRAARVEISGSEFGFAFELLKKEGRVAETPLLEAKELWQICEGAMQPLKEKKLACESEWLEIVAGERRWNGAKVVGCDCPVTVREMSDAEALEIQAAENLNREDLNAMDEAEKYRQMLEEYEIQGQSKAQAMEMLEKKTNRSKSTLYDRLSLLTLPEQVIEMTKSGKLPASHATLLAKIPDPKVTATLAKKITSPDVWRDNGSGVLSYARAKEMVDEEATFLANCAKWQSKKAEFEKKGLRVLTVEESKKAFPHGDYLRYGSGYVKSTDHCDLDADHRQYSKLWGKKKPAPVLGRGGRGSPIEIFVAKEANAAVTAAGVLKKRRTQADHSVAEKKRLEEEKAREAKILAAVDETIQKIASPNSVSSKALWATLAQLIAAQMNHPTIQAMSARRKVPLSDSNGSLIAFVKKLETERDCQAFVFEALIGGSYYFNEGAFDAVRKTFGLSKVQTSGK